MVAIRASGPVEEWGGITYALSAFDAALSRDWEVVPVIKVGSDLARRARDYLSTLHRLAPDAALVEVAAPNNRVELRYQSAERRSEVLTGGVPPWTWTGLVPLLRDLDALYVNFISGLEMDLETMQLCGSTFAGRSIVICIHCCSRFNPTGSARRGRSPACRVVPLRGPPPGERGRDGAARARCDGPGRHGARAPGCDV